MQLNYPLWNWHFASHATLQIPHFFNKSGIYPDEKPDFVGRSQQNQFP
ncbi:MAG: hypothetical protein F6K14_23900 [Symploca sp. SIO2C1]|nr:hypothetical protein [Symploca sp. SIO2C1]